MLLSAPSVAWSLSREMLPSPRNGFGSGAAPAAAGGAPAGTTCVGQGGSAARAADPPCPTQVVPAGAPPAAAGAAPEPKPLRGEGNISLDSDQATLGADNSMTLEGNVVVRQGEREIRANEVHYNPQDSSLSAPGRIHYSDPLVRVTGAGGSYSAAAGAEFKSAEFALRQRAARGAAQDMTLTPQGVIRLRAVMFTTCPAQDSSWQLKADSIMLDTRNRLGAGTDAQIRFMGVPLIYLPWVSFPLGNERKSGFLFPGIGNTSYGGCSCRCRTTGTS